jgi:hypothetical protein
MKALTLAVTLLSAVAAGVHGMPKYRVKVTADKATDFSKLKTYAWTTGWSAFDRTVDQQVVAAVDRELAALGLTKMAAEPSDVVVQYASLRRTDVDLKSKMSPDTKLSREYPVGTLIVLLLEPRSRREIFRARVDTPLETEPSKLEAQINSTIAQVFDQYPTKKAGRR